MKNAVVVIAIALALSACQGEDPQAAAQAAAAQAAAKEQAAEDMAQTGFANMCPVASVAGEISDTVEELRTATRDIFTAWIDGGTVYFASRGLDETLGRQVTLAIVGALEGAFLLARAMRDAEPLLAAGRTMAPQYRGIELTPRHVSGAAHSIST